MSAERNLLRRRPIGKSFSPTPGRCDSGTGVACCDGVKTQPGQSYPLGASWDGAGVNFALFSEHATGVELCFYDRAERTETARIPFVENTDQVWHIYLPEVRPGQRYGYRV